MLKTDREQTRARKADRQKSPVSRAMGLDHREGGADSASLNSQPSSLIKKVILWVERELGSSA